MSCVLRRSAICAELCLLLPNFEWLCGNIIYIPWSSRTYHTPPNGFNIFTELHNHSPNLTLKHLRHQRKIFHHWKSPPSHLVLDVPWSTASSCVPGIPYKYRPVKHALCRMADLVRKITMAHVSVPHSRVLPVHTAMHGWSPIVQRPADDGHWVAFMLGRYKQCCICRQGFEWLRASVALRHAPAGVLGNCLLYLALRRPIRALSSPETLVHIPQAVLLYITGICL